MSEMSVKKNKSTSKSFSSEGSSQNRLCKYIHRYCFQERIHGYDFCIRHILEDKNAPFKQCTFVQQPHRKRCTNAAPKTDKTDRREALCPFHAKQSLLKIKTPIPRKKEIKGPKALLRSLEHYCKSSRHDSEYSKEVDRAEKYAISQWDTQCPASLGPPAGELDTEKGSAEKFSGHVDIFGDHRDWEISSKDVLRHAGVFTGKEIIALAREKSMRLKSLYVDELKRTYYRLKELRREYLREVKLESKKHSGKSSDPKSKMLRYLESYHSPYGMDKVMRRKSEEKRMGITSQQPLCTFMQNGKKCSQTAIIRTSYCLNHILSDPNQCLFVPCSVTSNKKCDVPVLPIGNDFNVCKLHLYTTLLPESKEGQAVSSTDTTTEQEHFQSMDDIASLGLDDITPGSLFGLDQEAECVNTFFRNPSWGIKFEPNFGEPGESTDTVMSEEQADLMQIQPITLNPPADILSDARKSDIEEEK